MTELTNDTPTNTRSRARKVVAGTAVLVVGGGAAFAYWTVGGSGTGEATTGDAETLLITQNAVTGLAPGATAQTLTGSVSNPGEGAVRVGSVTGTIIGVEDADGTSIVGECALTNYAIVGSAAVNATVTGAGSIAWSGGTIQMVETGSNQDACKDATVVISYTSN